MDAAKAGHPLGHSACSWLAGVLLGSGGELLRTVLIMQAKALKPTSVSYDAICILYEIPI